MAAATLVVVMTVVAELVVVTAAVAALVVVMTAVAAPVAVMTAVAELAVVTAAVAATVVAMADAVWVVFGVQARVRVHDLIAFDEQARCLLQINEFYVLLLLVSLG